jgi:hypothetical protein
MSLSRLPAFIVISGARTKIIARPDNQRPAAALYVILQRLLHFHPNGAFAGPPGYRHWRQQVLPMLRNTLQAAAQQRALVVLPGTTINALPPRCT